MACGCNKGARRVVSSPRQGLAAQIRTASSSGQVQRNVSTSNMTAPRLDRSPSGLNLEKRKVAKIRRDALKKSLNKS